MKMSLYEMEISGKVNELENWFEAPLNFAKTKIDNKSFFAYYIKQQHWYQHQHWKKVYYET